jgi:hypothetical protein
VGAGARQASGQLTTPTPDVEHGLPGVGGHLSGQGTVDQGKPNAVQEGVHPPRVHPKLILSVIVLVFHQ